MDEIEVKTQESQEIQDQQKEPLLENNEQHPTKQPKTQTQKTIRKTFKRTTHLSSLLPSGSVLIFEMFSPILTNQGHCNTFLTHFSTVCLIIFVGLSCIFLCFIDSVRDQRGKVRYGIATFKGITILDGSMTLSPEEAFKYRIRFLDFVHAFMGILVFLAVVLLDQNVVKCLFPTPSEKLQEIFSMFPIVVGVFCGTFFVWFPSKRNGVVSPLSKN